jgi:cation transport ATPase
MPATFLLFLMFMLCALIGPLALLGVALAMFLPRWRQLGHQCAKFGLIASLLFYGAFEFLHMVLADSVERSAFSISVACSGGFTIGIVVMCVWTRARQFFTPVRISDS